MLAVSSLGLALGWSTAKLATDRWRAALPGLNRVVLGAPVRPVGRALVLAAFLFV